MADSKCGGRSVDEPGWPRFSSSLSTALTVISATCLAFLSGGFPLVLLLLAPLLGLGSLRSRRGGFWCRLWGSAASGAVSTADRASSARQPPQASESELSRSPGGWPAGSVGRVEPGNSLIPSHPRPTSLTVPPAPVAERLPLKAPTFRHKCLPEASETPAPQPFCLSKQAPHTTKQAVGAAGVRVCVRVQEPCLRVKCLWDETQTSEPAKTFNNTLQDTLQALPQLQILPPHRKRNRTQNHCLTALSKLERSHFQSPMGMLIRMRLLLGAVHFHRISHGHPHTGTPLKYKNQALSAVTKNPNPNEACQE